MGTLVVVIVVCVAWWRCRYYFLFSLLFCCWWCSIDIGWSTMVAYTRQKWMPYQDEQQNESSKWASESCKVCTGEKKEARKKWGNFERTNLNCFYPTLCRRDSICHHFIAVLFGLTLFKSTMRWIRATFCCCHWYYMAVFSSLWKCVCAFVSVHTTHDSMASRSNAQTLQCEHIKSILVIMWYILRFTFIQIKCDEMTMCVQRSVHACVSKSSTSSTASCPNHSIRSRYVLVK